MKKYLVILIALLFFILQVNVVLADHIVIEGADVIWYTPSEQSSITPYVPPRFIAVYANFLQRKALNRSPTFSATPRIISVFANLLNKNRLDHSSDLDNVTNNVLPRIQVSYANLISSTDLIPIYENKPPIFGTPNPANDSTNQPLNFTWSIPINDPEGDQFSWTIQCGNGQTNNGSGASNGTKTLSLSGLPYSTTYPIWVNATDPGGSSKYTRRWYTFTTGSKPNPPPTISQEYPSNNSIGNGRPPNDLHATIADPNGDSMTVYIRWMNHTGKWVTLQTYHGVGNGTYNFVPSGNNWIWGNTTYTWCVNVTDGISWTNRTYQYTTKGSRYDVNNDNKVNFQDAGLVWIHRTSLVTYDGLYDVNQDGQVNFQDAGLTWIHRD